MPVSTILLLYILTFHGGLADKSAPKDAVVVNRATADDRINTRLFTGNTQTDNTIASGLLGVGVGVGGILLTQALLDSQKKKEERCRFRRDTVQGRLFGLGEDNDKRPCQPYHQGYQRPPSGYAPGYQRPPSGYAPGYQRPPPSGYTPGYQRPPPSGYAPGYQRPPTGYVPGYQKPPSGYAPGYQRPANYGYVPGYSSQPRPQYYQGQHQSNYAPPVNHNNAYVPVYQPGPYRATPTTGQHNQNIYPSGYNNNNNNDNLNVPFRARSLKPRTNNNDERTDENAKKTEEAEKPPANSGAVRFGDE